MILCADSAVKMRYWARFPCLGLKYFLSIFRVPGTVTGNGSWGGRAMIRSLSKVKWQKQTRRIKSKRYELVVHKQGVTHESVQSHSTEKCVLKYSPLVRWSSHSFEQLHSVLRIMSWLYHESFMTGHPASQMPPGSSFYTSADLEDFYHLNSIFQIVCCNPLKT